MGSPGGVAQGEGTDNPGNRSGGEEIVASVCGQPTCSSGSWGTGTRCCGGHELHRVAGSCHRVVLQCWGHPENWVWRSNYECLLTVFKVVLNVNP